MEPPDHSIKCPVLRVETVARPARARQGGADGPTSDRPVSGSGTSHPTPPIIAGMDRDRAGGPGAHDRVAHDPQAHDPQAHDREASSPAVSVPPVR